MIEEFRKKVRTIKQVYFNHSKILGEYAFKPNATLPTLICDNSCNKVIGFVTKNITPPNNRFYLFHSIIIGYTWKMIKEENIQFYSTKLLDKILEYMEENID